MNAKNPTKSAGTTSSREMVPLGRPPIIAGENAADYEALRAHYVAALKPQCVIEYKYVKDMADAQWNVSRFRCAKSNFIDVQCSEDLKELLQDLVEPSLVLDEQEVAQIAKYKSELAKFDHVNSKSRPPVAPISTSLWPVGSSAIPRSSGTLRRSSPSPGARFNRSSL
jgi:hypothetical protein